MSHSINLIDVVALTEDIPQHKLHRGQVGTVVELLSQDAVEVEFSDDDGQTYAMIPLQEDQLMVLHYHLVETAGS